MIKGQHEPIRQTSDSSRDRILRRGGNSPSHQMKTDPSNHKARPYALSPLAGIVAYVSLAVSVMTLLSLSVVVSRMELFKADDSTVNPATAEQTIKGTVLMILEDMCVVRDAKGKGLLLQFTKATTISGPLAIGDKIEARLTSDGRALSVRKVP